MQREKQFLYKYSANELGSNSFGQQQNHWHVQTHAQSIGIMKRETSKLNNLMTSN
jgi:hypothetical protein